MGDLANMYMYISGEVFGEGVGQHSSRQRSKQKMGTRLHGKKGSDAKGCPREEWSR